MWNGLTGPPQFDSVGAQRLRDALISPVSVRPEIGADVHPTRLVGLGQLWNDIGGLATYHVESLPTGLAQFLIKCDERSHQPSAARSASGRQQCGIENEERQHRLPVVDRRTKRRIVG